MRQNRNRQWVILSFAACLPLWVACPSIAQSTNAIADTRVGANQVAAAVVQRPNVLFIVVDDLRPELGCYDNQEIRTPHFDQFSSGATTFMRAYCDGWPYGRG